MRLNQLEFSLKILISLVLICLCIGLIQGYLYLNLKSQNKDLKKTPLQQIEKRFYVPKISILEYKIKGSMRKYLETEEEYNLVYQWIKKKGNDQFYTEKVAVIIEESCIDCHSPDEKASFADFTDYQTLKSTTIFSYKPYLISMLRKAHPHMLMIPFIFLPLSLLIYFTPLASGKKSLLINAPFIFILIDINSWFLTIFNKNFSIFILIGGGLQALIFFINLFICFYYLWIYKDK
ncbi:MAG: hypothetical protein COB02_02815 [Candidatus Cloacimonadota bacterium]|nr:MAG: hypothetical protein COB02_02815 [Candidatus Cloacimonadota bacterium]